MPQNKPNSAIPARLAALADAIAAHTDGVGLGIAYEAFVIDRVELPARFVTAIHQAGFAFDPRIIDASGWHRYPAQDHSFTVAVEGWGDHCLGRSHACTRREFAAELARRIADSGEQLLAVLWRRIPLVLHTDREGVELDPPLRFRVVSFAAIAGYHPYDPDTGGFETPSTLADFKAAPAAPKALYHATPLYNLDSIFQRGLLATRVKSATLSGRGVFLTDEPSLARNYGESRFGVDDYAAPWVLLKIDPQQLDLALFEADLGQEAELNAEAIEARGYTLLTMPWWVSLEETGQIVYAGDIPMRAIEPVEVMLPAQNDAWVPFNRRR